MRHQPSTRPDTPTEPRRRWHGWALCCLVVGALALRLWGIGWGLPGPTRLCSYHPDEGVNLVNAVLEHGRNPRPHLDLGFYNYGSLYFYLWQAGVAVNQTYGLVALPPTAPNAAPATDSFGAMTLVGRLLSALLGAGTVWAVFALGRRLFGAATGFGAAALYAVMPAAVVHGHFATVDVPATFFVALALVAGSRLLTRPDARTCVAAGVLSGLAAATKYNAALVALAPLAAVFLSRKPASGVPWRALWIVVASAVGGFLVGCPGILMNWPGFARDFAFELHKSGQGMGLLFADTGSGYVYHVVRSLRYGLGEPLLAAAVAAVVWACWRRSRQDAYLAAFALPYYVLIGYAQVRFLRYTIPLLPVLAVWTSRLTVDAVAATRPIARLAALLGAAGIAFALYVSVAHDRMMAGVDARDLAADYVGERLAPGQTVAFATIPWFYSPPLDPQFTAPIPGEARRRLLLSADPERLRLPAEGREWDPAVLEAPPPQFVVLSADEMHDPVRLRQADALAFLAQVRSRYAARVFVNRCDSLPRPDDAPIDWLYAWPRVFVYERAGR